MSRTCTNCGKPFTVSDADLAFLAKISPVIGGRKHDIPAPTHCPDCRQQRRLTWRNERKLYHRTCDLTGQDIISTYSPDKPHKVYSPDAWNSDKWNALEHGRDFDFNRPFFEQMRELQEAVPRIALNVVSNENSPYINLSGYNKNCHLIFAAEYNEDCLYGRQVIKSKSCVDTLNCYESERCYEVIDCEKNYNLAFSKDCSGCTDSFFLSDCKGCNDCLFCINLRNKKYHIFNKEYSKEEFEQQKTIILQRLQAEGSAALQQEFRQFTLQHPHRDLFKINCENADGDFLQNSRNLRHCFDLSYADECAYVYTGFQVKDLMDVCHTTEMEIGYEGVSFGYKAYNCMFTHSSWSSNNSFYCDIVQSCTDCFGCICLRQQKFCILNKQYTKEEYEELVPRIIDHMKKTGEWGEFFPHNLSPFAYNETLAQEYYPMNKEEVTARGWQWREEVEEAPQVDKVVPASQLPASIDDVPDDILQWAVLSEESQKPFRIIKQELQFYRDMHLPLPRITPDERHAKRMQQRNPRQLWDRQCMKCGKGIKTTYAPDRPEIVYCEECYLASVY